MSEPTNESYLSLRVPSNEKDERFISGINSSYEAAKLRSASKDSKVNEYHSPVKFSWREFWKGAVTRRKEIKVHETNVESPIPMAPEVVLADAEPADLGGAFDACAAALPFVPAGCLRP